MKDKHAICIAETYEYLRPGGAYMRTWNRSFFVAKPLTEPMLACYWLDCWENISMKFKSETKDLFRKMYSKVLSTNIGDYIKASKCQGL